MSTVEQQLLTCICKKCDIQEFANLASKLLEAPISIEDFSRNTIAECSDFPTDDIDDRINRTQKLPIERRQKNFSELYLKLLDNVSIIEELPLMRRRRIVHGIFYEHSLIAYIVIPEMQTVLENLNQQLLNQICQCAGILLALNHFPIQSNVNDPSIFLWNVLNDKINLISFETRMLLTEFKGIEHFQMMYMPPQQNAELFLNDVKQQYPNCWFIKCDKGYAVLFGYDQSIHPTLLTETLKYGVNAGVGSVFNELNELMKSFKEAESAIEYARKYKNEKGLILFNQYKIQALLNNVSDKVNLINYCDEVLETIRLHDEINHTAYIKTLRCYLYNDLNPSQTAAEMYIHKNTVLYRLTRLNELFGINLDNLQQLTSLYLSMLILDETYCK